jgi:hypothetical protein
MEAKQQRRKLHRFEEGQTNVTIHHLKCLTIQEQREQVKASSQRLKKVLDFLERTLLRERAEKKKQQLIDPGRGGTSSNIFQRSEEQQLAMTEMAMYNIH